MTWGKWLKDAPGIAPIVTLLAALAACVFAWFRVSSLTSFASSLCTIFSTNRDWKRWVSHSLIDDKQESISCLALRKQQS